MEVLIYRVRNNITKKVYIGQTRRYRSNENFSTEWAVYKRWKEHVRASKDPGVNVFHNAIKKYTAMNFTVRIIDGCPINLANDLETSYIMEYDSINKGYNGNRGLGKKLIPLPYARGHQRDLINKYNQELDRKLNQNNRSIWRKIVDTVRSWFN